MAGWEVRREGGPRRGRAPRGGAADSVTSRSDVEGRSRKDRPRAARRVHDTWGNARAASSHHVARHDAARRRSADDAARRAARSRVALAAGATRGRAHRRCLHAGSGAPEVFGISLRRRGPSCGVAPWQRDEKRRRPRSSTLPRSSFIRHALAFGAVLVEVVCAAAKEVAECAVAELAVARRRQQQQRGRLESCAPPATLVARAAVETLREGGPRAVGGFWASPTCP